MPIFNIYLLKKNYKYRRFKTMLLGGLFFICNNIYTQDIPISQYYSNLVSLNPSFAGVLPEQRINLYYRNQWPFSSSLQQSFGFSYDIYIEKINGGVGVLLSNESFGVNYAPSIDFIYSYGVEILRGWYVNMGVQAGVVQKIRGSSAYNFEEPEIVSVGFSKVFPDFAIGVVSFYKNVYGGFSIDHFARPDQSYTTSSAQARIDRKYTMHFGVLKYFKTRLQKQERILSPNIIIQIQGLQQNINWGTSFQYDYLIGGLWLRHNLFSNADAMIFSAGIKTQQYKFAYSYDMNMGKKVSGGFGAHEISFTYLIENKNIKKHRGIKCPTFLQ